MADEHPKITVDITADGLVVLRSSDPGTTDILLDTEHAAVTGFEMIQTAGAIDGIRKYEQSLKRGK